MKTLHQSTHVLKRSVQAHIPWLSTRALASVEAAIIANKRTEIEINDAAFSSRPPLLEPLILAWPGLAAITGYGGVAGGRSGNRRPSSRLASIDHFFETPTEHENDEDENNADTTICHCAIAHSAFFWASALSSSARAYAASSSFRRIWVRPEMDSEIIKVLGFGSPPSR